jgi:hypothetical protein
MTLNASADFTTTYQNHAYGSSFIDSGSNAIFFLDDTTSGLPMCSTAKDFYCPANPVTFIATNKGVNGTSKDVSFSIASAETLFNANPGFFDFTNLGGPMEDAFDWGLPFFYGRNVYTAIEGQKTPAGMGPYWAY